MLLTVIFTYLVFINLFGFAAFGIDKSKAVHHKWRIRESVLFLIAVLGGSPGCLIGMQFFHHKTKHRSFTIGIPLILALELIVGCSLFYYFTEHMPYQQDPGKLVQHEFSSITEQDTSSIKHLLNISDVFPSTDSTQALSSDVTAVFSGFFHNFSYRIQDIRQSGKHASVNVILTTLDGKAVAKEYSRQVMIKQIQNSASPASVDFSLEDCYLLLGNVLQQNTLQSITSDYTITLTKSGKLWNIDSPKSLSAALTGNFASYVADPSLFSPAEIIAIHLDTLKSFDTEQLNRYLALDSLFPTEVSSARSMIRAVAGQLHSCLDYSIQSEDITEDGANASVALNLTSCDFSSIVSAYQKQYTSYLNSSQALEDGTDGRQAYAADLLCNCITDNTATVTTPVTVQLTNDGNNWRIIQNDDMTVALLGNLEEALTTVRTQLET